LLGGVVFSVVLLSMAWISLPSLVLTQSNPYSSEIQSVFAQQPQFSETISLTKLFEQSELGVVSISVTKTSSHGTFNINERGAGMRRVK